MIAKRMKRDYLPTWGIRYLGRIEAQNSKVAGMKKELADYDYDESKEDLYAWLSCVLALKAFSLGNFGVGSLVIDAEGSMVAWGHNKVFEPRFASDLHAEMVAMDSFEKTSGGNTRTKKYSLFTSVESCPMCLLRLINSGIGTVIHVAPDSEGGMVHRMENAPPAWLKLAAKQSFRQADCSPTLIGYADKIFQSNLQALYRKIEQR
jgi:cytosine deaminase